MALDGEELGEKLYKALDSAAGSDVTEESKGWGKGIVKALKVSLYTNIAFTGAGVPNGGPYQGSAVAGKFLMIPPPLIVAEVLSTLKGNAVAIAPQVVAHANGIVAYLIASGMINFPSVEGTCTATTGVPPAPGPLVAGKASGGKLAGLQGAAMMAFVAPFIGGLVGPDSLPWYSALCDYLMQKTEFEYPPNSVNGLFPPGGGPLVGVGLGGTVK